MSKTNILIEQLNFNNNTECKKDENNESKTETTDQMDYYAILGIKRDSSGIDIKRAYQKKLKKFHPDKTKPTKENKLKYKLIREAGDILTNIQKRKAYDIQFKINKDNQNFLSQKESFNEFIRLQEKNMTDDDRKIAKLNFDKSIFHMNNQHGSDIDMKPLSSLECNRRMEDIMLQREQEEFDINQDNIFEGRNFNSSEFNNIFENKKQKTKKSDGIVLYKDKIQAYNSNDNEGVSLDDYNLLYSSDNYTGINESYSNYNNSFLETDINNDNNSDSNSDDISIDSLDDNDYKISTNSLDTDIKNIILERKIQDSKFTNMTDVDFGSALDDEYGISKQFGFMIGNDRNGQQNINNTLSKSNIKIYKELTQE